MQHDLYDRARSALHDYAIWLRERGDRSDRRADTRAERVPKSATARERKRAQKGRTSYSEAAALVGLNWWWRQKEVELKAAGRMTEDGFIRTSDAPRPPYTLQDVARAWPHLKEPEQVACLIELDGVVEEGFMDAHKYIRETMEKIADERIERARLQRTDEKPMREIIREEVGAIFQELLGRLGGAPAGGRTVGVPVGKGPGMRKCSRCGEAGHRAPACPNKGVQTPDKWACVHCSNLQGAPLSSPVTHPVPPDQFHQGDPSYKPEAEPEGAPA